MKAQLRITAVLLMAMSIGCDRPDIGSVTYDQGKCHNATNGTVEIVLDSMGLHFQTMDEIVEDARNFAPSSSPPISAWKYVTDLSMHGYPMSFAEWLSDPAVYVNSVRWGFCDDAAQVLASIWREMGYPSRVWYLEGHVVAEFQDSLGWHLMDADKSAYFTAADGKIASYEEIVSGDVTLLKLHRASKLRYRSLGYDMGLHSDKVVENDLKRLIRSTGNNNASQLDERDVPKLGNQLTVPSGSSVTYLSVMDGGAVKALMKVAVPPNSVGVLYLPFACVIVEKATGGSTTDEMLYQDHVNNILPKEGIAFNGNTSDTLTFWFLASGLQVSDSSFTAPVVPFRSIVNRLSGNWAGQLLAETRMLKVLTPAEMERIDEIEKSLGNIPCLETPQDLMQVYENLLAGLSRNASEHIMRKRRLAEALERYGNQNVDEKSETTTDFDQFKCSHTGIAAAIFLLTETDWQTH